LHDAGQIVLAAGLPDAFEECIAATSADDVGVHQAELDRFGVTHAEVGAYLLGLWGMPYSIIEAVANHHTPRRSPRRDIDTVAAVHIASALVGGEAGALDLELVEQLDLTDRLEQWRGFASEVGEAA
jgi:HD-like signal output (HDOD) protein